MASVATATAVVAFVLVRIGCHMAVGAGGAGMVCTTVGVGGSSMARTTGGAGDDGMVVIDSHTAVGAGRGGACDGEMMGIDCHKAVGVGNVWPVDTADLEPKSGSAVVMGSAVGAVKRANRMIPSARSIASEATATATVVAAATPPVGRVWIGEGIGSAMVTAGIPVVMATGALAGRAATADRTTGIAGYVLGDRAIGSVVTDGCSPGTAVGAGDGGIIRTVKFAGDGGMARTDGHTAVGAGCGIAGGGEMVGIDCHTAVGAGKIWPVDTAVGAGDVWLVGTAVGAGDVWLKDTAANAGDVRPVGAHHAPWSIISTSRLSTVAGRRPAATEVGSDDGGNAGNVSTPSGRIASMAGRLAAM
jgi:hypothetical protein